MAEQENGQTRVATLRETDHRGDIGNLLGDMRDMKALAIRLAAPAKIKRAGCETRHREMAGWPQGLAAVRVDAAADDDDLRDRLPSSTP